jgi:hypothetical protein
MMNSNLLALQAAAENSDIANYCLALSSLSPKQTNTETPVAGPSGTQLGSDVPILSVYAPFAIFFIMFIAVFGTFMVGRIRNWKMGVSAFLLACTLAATPFLLQGMERFSTSSVRAGPDEIPRNIIVMSKNTKSALITWTTDKEQTGGVKLNELRGLLKNERTFIGNSGGKTKNHTVLIDGLILGKTYEFELLSGVRWYDNNGSRATFQFTR